MRVTFAELVNVVFVHVTPDAVTAPLSTTAVVVYAPAEPLSDVP